MFDSKLIEWYWSRFTLISDLYVSVGFENSKLMTKKNENAQK